MSSFPISQQNHFFMNQLMRFGYLSDMQTAKVESSDMQALLRSLAFHTIFPELSG